MSQGNARSTTLPPGRSGSAASKWLQPAPGAETGQRCALFTLAQPAPCSSGVRRARGRAPWEEGGCPQGAGLMTLRRGPCPACALPRLRTGAAVTDARSGPGQPQQQRPGLRPSPGRTRAAAPQLRPGTRSMLLTPCGRRLLPLALPCRRQWQAPGKRPPPPPRPASGLPAPPPAWEPARPGGRRSPPSPAGLFTRRGRSLSPLLQARSRLPWYALGGSQTPLVGLWARVCARFLHRGWAGTWMPPSPPTSCIGWHCHVVAQEWKQMWLSEF